MSQRYILDKLDRQLLCHWDVAIQVLLSTALIAALTCRGGDIVCGTDYVGGEYPQWKDILLLLDGGSKVENLVAYVTLKAEKAKKLVVLLSLYNSYQLTLLCRGNHNNHKVVRLGPLLNPDHNVADPVKLLLIHGLRDGLLECPTLAMTLELASRCVPQRVHQAAPDALILAAHRRRATALDFNAPANQRRTLTNLRQMAITTCLLQLIRHQIYDRAGLMIMSIIEQQTNCMR